MTPPPNTDDAIAAVPLRDAAEAPDPALGLISSRRVAMLYAAGLALAMLSTGSVRAQEVPPSDLLLATLWTQRSVEFKGNALTVFALARIRLDIKGAGF